MWFIGTAQLHCAAADGPSDQTTTLTRAEKLAMRDMTLPLRVEGRQGDVGRILWSGVNVTGDWLVIGRLDTTALPVDEDNIPLRGLAPVITFTRRDAINEKRVVAIELTSAPSYDTWIHFAAESLLTLASSAGSVCNLLHLPDTVDKS